jgi:hypothetical protein
MSKTPSSVDVAYLVSIPSSITILILSLTVGLSLLSCVIKNLDCGLLFKLDRFSVVVYLSIFHMYFDPCAIEIFGCADESSDVSSCAIEICDCVEGIAVT